MTYARSAYCLQQPFHDEWRKSHRQLVGEQYYAVEAKARGTDHSFDTASYAANGEDKLLTTDMMKWFWDHYLDNGSGYPHPLASPLRAATHDRLPPALVITAEYDPLRDEGEAYAHKLLDAGVPVTLSRYDGMIHGFFQMLAVFRQASDAADEAAAALRTTFA